MQTDLNDPGEDFGNADEASDAIERLEDRLRAELGPEYSALVEQLSHAHHRHHALATGELMDQVAAHFPGIAPALLAVYRHAWESGRYEECGLQVDKRTWPGWDNCAAATRAPSFRPTTRKRAAS
jgi:hypothetical protein